MKAFAQSIVESVPYPLALLDVGLSVFVANPAFYSAFGIPSVEASGLSRHALHPGWLDIIGLRERVERVVITGHPFEGFEVEHNFAGAGPRALRLNARRVVSDEDGAFRVLVAVEDMTDIKRADQALRRLNDELEVRVQERTAQLEAANKEMEAFCYSVSHDLRAPLRAIDGFSQELLRSYADQVDDRGRHYLTRVRANSQRMAELIDDLLQLSRLSRVEMRYEAVDLSTLASAVVADLQQREPHRQVTFTVQPGVTVRGDAGLLRVALENLLGNAWKFTSKKPIATITLRRQKDAAGFYVRDDGAGFDPAFVGKLFGAFQRLHHERDFPGTGIGLATVQRVAHRHGGTVRAEGAVGQGATFYFTLPQGNDA